MIRRSQCHVMGEEHLGRNLFPVEDHVRVFNRSFFSKKKDNQKKEGGEREKENKHMANDLLRSFLHVFGTFRFLILTAKKRGNKNDSASIRRLNRMSVLVSILYTDWITSHLSVKARKEGKEKEGKHARVFSTDHSLHMSELSGLLSFAHI